MNADSIQSMGGKARDKALSDEQKQEIARKAALTRWAGARPLNAIRKGNFKDQFGIDVDVYVLDDHNKTAVISQRGMGRALGLSEGGSKLQAFLNSKSIAPLVGPELARKLMQPIKFQWGTGGPEQPPSTVHGYDVTLLIDLCRMIVEANHEGKLNSRHQRTVAQAQTLIIASAKSGIKGLVYALAGYNPTADEVISAFKVYVLEEAKKYEKEFPPELYAEWHRLYNIPALPQGRSWHFKHLTVNHIYYPLAKSNGKILELIRAMKASGDDRKKKLFQFLSEIGTRALRLHLGRVQEMAESSIDRKTYDKKITDRFGGQQELDFGIQNQ